jgi:hypothetical protein
MLKPVIEDDNVHTEALDCEHASSVSILPYDHRHAGEMLC